MIGFLEGKCISKENDGTIILNVNGVGYVVLITKDLYNSIDLNDVDCSISLFVETKVRENDITLYGFMFQYEKMWFNRLVNVQGVGGKVALNVLSLGVEQINNALYNREIGVLTMADGVGKKVAERMVTELSKFAIPPQDDVVSLVEKKQLSDNSVKALISLGYSKKEVEFVVKDLMLNLDSSNFEVAYIVQQSLLRLAK